MHDVSYLLVLVTGLLLAVAAVAGLARRFAMSYPIALVIFGLLCSLIPRVPRIPLPPSIVFFVILPPLLYIAAWQTSWREFKYNLVSISSLAVLQVFFTAAMLVRRLRRSFSASKTRKTSIPAAAAFSTKQSTTPSS